MTKQEIIELALEAGFDTYESYCLSGESELDMTLAVEEYPIGKTVFKFAELVAAKERERCAQMAEACAYMSENFNALAEEIRSLK